MHLGGRLPGGTNDYVPTFASASEGETGSIEESFTESDDEFGQAISQGHNTVVYPESDSDAVYDYADREHPLTPVVCHNNFIEASKEMMKERWRRQAREARQVSLLCTGGLHLLLLVMLTPFEWSGSGLAAGPSTGCFPHSSRCR